MALRQKWPQGRSQGFIGGGQAKAILINHKLLKTYFINYYI